MSAKVPNLGKLDPSALLAVYREARSRLVPKVNGLLDTLAEKTRALEALQEEIAAQQCSVEPRTVEAYGDGHNIRPAERKKTASDGSPLAGRKIEPKYRNPQNPAKTWAGRGLPPKWLLAYECAGRKREEFRIGTPSAPSHLPPLNASITVQEPLPFKQPDAFTEALKTLGSSIRFDRNQEIQADGEPALYFYQVVSGAVRTYKLLSDGRRQISAFALPGDFIELGTTENYCFSAEAISRSLLRFAKRSAIVDLAARNADLAVEIWGRTAKNLRYAQEHMMLLGRKNADERLASFLLEMAERSGSESILELPMSRQDMADHLGLRIETVSRMLTHLESRAAIRRESGRRLELHNRDALNVLNA